MSKKNNLSSKSFFTSLKNSLSSWSGLNAGLTSLQDMGVTRGLFSEKLQLYRENCARESLFERLPFSEVLKAWGIENESHRILWIRQKRLERLLGIALFLFGLLAYAFNEKSVSSISLCTSLACLSVSLLGFVLALTRTWRLSCLKNETFLPFARWVQGILKKILRLS